MMLPILISVSVAPVSYCFCASAALESTVVRAAAIVSDAVRPYILGISISLGHGVTSLTSGLCGSAGLKRVSLHRATKSPFRLSSAGACLVLCALGEEVKLAAELAFDRRAEHVPLVAGEAHHAELLDRIEIGRRGVDLDTGQHGVRGKILQRCRLLHDVGAGQV